VRGTAFGLEIVSSLPLPGPWQAPTAESFPRLEIVSATRDELETAWTGAGRLGWQGRVDGQHFRVDQGRGGDLRMRLEPFIDIHLAADGATLRVDAGSDRVRAARVLLDSALFTVSLWLGNEALHAGAVAVPTGIIAVVGPTGAGKSSLVAALLAAGCSFVTDDVLVVRSREGSVLGLPGSPVITVPNPAPPGLGELIADLGGESWLGIGTVPAELPLAVVVYLDLPGRASEASAGQDWREPLVHFLRFPRTRERERSRFELAAELALRVPVLRLAQSEGSPEQLANRVLDWA
jgi:hypothetical protein